jgi:hypothetical protein
VAEEHALPYERREVIVKNYLPALKYIVLGPLIFWAPSVFLHLLRGDRFAGIEAITLTILLPLITCLALAFYWRIQRTPQDKLTFALFAVLGIWLFGPVMMSVSWSSTGGGFSHPDSSHSVLIETCMFPVFTFIMSTYDGTLGALLLTSVLLPSMSMLSGRAKQV